MHTRENIRNGFWFSLGFGVAILVLAAGCFYLAEAGLNLLQEKGETEMDEDEKMTERCREFDKPQVKEPKQPFHPTRFIEAWAVVDRIVTEDLITVPPVLAACLPAISDALKIVIGAADVVGHIDFKEDMFALRAQIEETKIQTILVFEGHPVWEAEQTAHNANDPNEGAAKRARDHAEMKANLMLTYRHLEDARMRLGKAIQAFDGGKSCYER